MISKSEEEIMKTWDTVNYNHPVVSIRCLAYNHRNYIGRTLDGFLSQITDFPFEIIVNDDASPDGTADVIRRYEKKYPNIVKPIYQKENMFSSGRGDVMRKMINDKIQGDYIALCEGDDYWIDEKKLQKQIDFLMLNKDYGMCYTDFNIYYQSTGKFEYSLLKTQPEKYPSEFSLKKWIMSLSYIGPMTWVARRDIWLSYERIPSCDGTFVLFAHFIKSAKVKCLKDETTAVYRILDESAAHSKDISKVYIRYMNLHDLQKKVADRYNLGENFKKKIDSSYYKKRFKIICLLGDKEERENCKKYCSGFYFKAMYLATKFSFVRNAVLYCYKLKNKK